MSEDAWRQSATTDVLFPDDLEGYGPICVIGEPLEAADIDTDTVQFGLVAALAGEHHEADYVVAPRQLREIIAACWRPDDGCATFEITEAKKGPADDDEWRLEFRCIESGDPL